MINYNNGFKSLNNYMKQKKEGVKIYRPNYILYVMFYLGLTAFRSPSFGLHRFGFLTCG